MNITKRLKSQPTIKPTEYMPIIKELDKTGSGIVDAKDLLKFLETYSKKFAFNCILDLKYIANFLEFKAQNRSTRSFLQQNSSKFKIGERLKEIDCMTELNGLFGISSTAGGTIFKKLSAIKKGEIEKIMLEDLANLIDEYRLVKVEPEKTKPGQ